MSGPFVFYSLSNCFLAAFKIFCSSLAFNSLPLMCAGVNLF